MRNLPGSLQDELSETLGTPIRQLHALGGGDINEACRLLTDRGPFFLKYNSQPKAAAMFATEASGLMLLHEAGARVPAVIKNGLTEGGAYLLLEFVEPTTQNAHFWDDFGASLARLHAIPQPYFGLPFDNFIGSLEQPNGRHDSFVDLFTLHRLQNQVELAIRNGRLNRTDERQFEHLYQKLPSLLPDEPPALIHGDLWGGNFLCGPDALAVLIDPAVAWAHREMDLAMSRLFGGFSRQFYEAYESAYPLAPGFAERVEVYQLYYLLVHVNLFGGSYSQSVRRVLQRFAGR